MLLKSWVFLYRIRTGYTSTKYKELFSKLRIIGSNLQLIVLILPENGSITSYEFPITKNDCLYKVTVFLVV